MNLFASENRHTRFSHEPLGYPDRTLRLAHELMDLLPGLESTPSFETRAQQLAPSIHMFLAETALIDPNQDHFVGITGPQKTFRITRERTLGHPYRSAEFFADAKDVARRIVGLRSKPQPQELAMSTATVPTLIAVMIAHATDGFAGGGNEQIILQDRGDRLSSILIDQLSQIGLELPHIELTDKRAIRQSLGLQPVESALPDSD